MVEVGESATTTATTTLTINSTDASGSTYDAFDDKQVMNGKCSN